MLQEIAIADAYGAGFEFTAVTHIQRHNNLAAYQPHALTTYAGKYTDDTQMSLAIAELLLSDDDWLNGEKIIQNFLNCYHRDPHGGYAKGFQGFLNTTDNAKDFIRNIRNTSDRNGAAMRSVPIGYIPDIQTILRFASVQASVTHNSEVAIQSSQAVALAAYFGLHQQGALHELVDFLRQHHLGNWNYQWQQPVSSNSYETVSAAFTALLKHNNLGDLLVDCISFSGDTDSIASIALGIACCFPEYENNLPKHLYHDLDEPVIGLAYLRRIDQALKKHFIR